MIDFPPNSPKSIKNLNSAYTEKNDVTELFFLSAVNLKANSFYLEEVTKSISNFDEMLEKSLGQTKAPQKRGVKLAGRAFAGHTGTGVRPSRSPKLSSVPTAVNPTASSAENFFSPIGGYKVTEAKENWQGHHDLHVGSIVEIQHPFKHEKPISGQIIAIGKDGIIALDREGDSHKIRWQHILNISAIIHKNSPHSEISEANVELSRMNMPVSHPESLSHHDLHEATKYLRGINLPLEQDLVNFDTEDTLPVVYQELVHQGIPVDPVALTEQKKFPKQIPEHLQGIISHIQSLGAQIDTKILSELPYDQIMKVLEHYTQRKKEENKK